MRKDAARPSYWVLDIKKELPDIMKCETISPLHYGDTVEICFVRGIEGETFINGKRFEYGEENVFFIPPKHLHTSVYRSGGAKRGDMLCAFHINIDKLSDFVDLKSLFIKDNSSLFDVSFKCDDFDALWEIVQSILDNNRNFSARVIDLLRLFEIISEQKNTKDRPLEFSKMESRFIDFVEENYSKKLTVQSAAEYFGYSKQYFCKWFKEKTEVTFNEFLNSVRIHHACSFLANGCLVEETAALCGFSDPSYFTKVFKRYIGVAPKTYASKNPQV